VRGRTGTGAGREGQGVIPLGRHKAGERIGAVASVVIFIAVYAACFSTLGVVLTLALGWLPAALAALLGAHAVRFLFRSVARAKAQKSQFE
jgi:hypothetical protein